MEGAWSLESDANVPARTEPSLAERFEAELPALRRFAHVLVGRPGADADDVVQEVLTRAWRSRAGFDASRPLQPWLRTTAVRAWIDLRRRQARQADVERAHGREATGHADAAHPLEEREGLERILATLDPVERDVLDRFHSHGEPVRAIATALGLAEGTVKSHLHRARKKLAERGELDR